MHAEDFRRSTAGHLVPTINGAMAFVPRPLPPVVDLGRLAGRISSAAQALGELSGMGRALQNPHLLILPFRRVEAVASSKIEGTVTTLPELLRLEIEADESKARHDTIEVRNYQLALNHGLKRLETLPTTVRLMCEMHKILLRGVSPARGAHIQPGELKTNQNWIGARLIQNARFVPPPPKESAEALGQLEKYIHSNDDLPLLVQLAIIHYQFEAIHPFPDGNGRIGRILIPLILHERGAMTEPLLYLSAYFEERYDEYIDLMYEVSRHGKWEPWIDFFINGVEVSCRSAIYKSAQLQELHRNYLERVQSARSSALLAKIVDSMFAVPATTIPITTKRLGISYNAAKNNINKLIELGILDGSFDKSRPQIFVAWDIIGIVSPDKPPPAKTEQPTEKEGATRSGADAEGA